MAVREILTVGHPVLRERAREVIADELAGHEMQALIDDLIDTMHARQRRRASPPPRSACRCASRSIEVNHNPRYPYKPPIPLTVVVNPVIEPIDDELVEINEGCLSVPNLRGNVMRHVNIRVRYLDRDGVEHDEIKRGLTAGTYQHECDHLDGMLFLDRVHDTALAHDVGAVRAPPPRRVRGPHHRVRPTGSVRDDAATGASWRGSAATPSPPA